MLTDVLRQHKDIVLSWNVMEWNQDGPNLRLKARVDFIDHSTLFIRQIVTAGNLFKYAYHWQDTEGHLRCRWDNAPHWPRIATFPHHKHVGEGSDLVKESTGGELAPVFGEIEDSLRTCSS